jgi:A/G-specific adenine glycosylase
MDPYPILVSELMLQQTQVTTVVGYYQRWLDRFPTIRDLADAEESSVLHMWQGLGYYRRARNLHQCAKMIVGKFDGRFPSTVEELMRLPGIGKYTAGAVVSFAFNRPAPIVDANIARVLSRLANVQEQIDRPPGERTVWELAGRFAKGGTPRLSNSALMDLGATICVPREPLCGICPVKAFCRAKDPGSLPKKRKRPAIEEKKEYYFFALRQDHVLLEQRAGRRWQGLWTLPVLGETLMQVQSRTSEDPFVCIRHPITRFVIELKVFLQEPPEKLRQGQEWKAVDSIENLAMPSPHREALKLVLARKSGELLSSRDFRVKPCGERLGRISRSSEHKVGAGERPHVRQAWADHFSA